MEGQASPGLAFRMELEPEPLRRPLMVSRTKYRKAADLYVVGTEVVLKDDTVLWVQALNPFDYDEAQRIGAAARARFQLAMREYGSDELVRFEAQAAEMPVEAKAARIAEVKASEIIQKAIGELESEDEWAEIRAVLDRSDELREGSDEEKRLIEDKNKEYIAEVNRRVEAERDYLEKKWLAADESELDAALRELYVDHVAGERATREYEVVEVFLGTRACDGVLRDDLTYSHEACESHVLTAFETKAEVRGLPEELFELIREGFARLNMHPTDPKDSGSPANSSESSPLPNEPADSEASTQEEASNDAPGTSTPPLATP
jgi:hypothetical protein